MCCARVPRECAPQKPNKYTGINTRMLCLDLDRHIFGANAALHPLIGKSHHKNPNISITHYLGASIVASIASSNSCITYAMLRHALRAKERNNTDRHTHTNRYRGGACCVSRRPQRDACASTRSRWKRFERFIAQTTLTKNAEHDGEPGARASSQHMCHRPSPGFAAALISLWTGSKHVCCAFCDCTHTRGVLRVCVHFSGREMRTFFFARCYYALAALWPAGFVCGCG